MAPFIIAILVSVSPFLYLFTKWQVLGDIVYTFANISGLVGATLFVWQYSLGIRHIAEALFGKNPVRVKLHMYLGIYGTFFILVHPFLEMISYGQSLSFVFVPSFANATASLISYGRIAFLAFVFVWITSAIIRNRLPYSTWHKFHYTTYILMAFVFIHATTLGTFLRTQPLIRDYWYLLGGVYLFLMGWRVIYILKEKFISKA